MVLMTEEEREALKRELLEKASNFTYFKDRKDDFRAETASSAGGFELRDADLTNLLRSAGTELIGVRQTLFDHGSNTTNYLTLILHFCSDGRT